MGRSRQGRRLARSQVQARRTEALVDMIICAEGALHQAALLLALKIIFRTKPAFKDMAMPTLEIQYLHN